MIAAPASGHGKTTVATGLMAALARTGLEVSGHKVGPDYIDPGYHALATGRPGRNLDPYLVGEDRVAPLLLHGAGPLDGRRAADVAVIEGVMGLYDGQLETDGFSSTAHVAALTRTPVVLVVDVSHASRTIGAVVHGLVSYDPRVEVAGVILNKAGSARHADEVRRAIRDVPVLGVLHRDAGIEAPSRHLGLVPAAERSEAAHSLDVLAERIATAVDLDAVLRIARSADPLGAEPWRASDHVAPPATVDGARPVVAMAGGRAFTFRYAETEELLRAAGCDVVTFDPLEDAALPDRTAGIYLGGGFPEVHAADLAANQPLRAALAAAVADGVPTVAECAGLLYLCRAVDSAPMVGVVDADAVMTPRLTLGYRRAVAPYDSLLGPAGTTVTAHEFHRTTVEPHAGALAAWRVGDRAVGFAGPALHASYLHTHWAGHPALAQAFADAVHGRASTARTSSRSVGAPVVTGIAAATTGAPMLEANGDRVPTPDLRHHGDVEVRDADLVDLAVNVWDGPRPPWLDDALRSSLDDLHHYPEARTAEAALAARHGRTPEEVLATAGAAEAFGLVARLRPWRRPVVVHPQFTEPDVALAEAGRTVTHVVLDATGGYSLDPARVPGDADLVVVGNPTNPTSRLHPADTVRAVARPGRLVVVDEAFMDFVPGETASLATARTAGVLVIRSLTKLWSIPGVRAGYVLGEPDVIAALRAAQAPWSVSTTAGAAMRACATDDAAAEAGRRAATTAAYRQVLTDGLDALSIPYVADPAGPFVLARPGAGVREQLREAGFALRRCDTFPGLDATWVRIAVRPPDVTARLLDTLHEIAR
ncbi:cobyrinate a,c-diamide synthase [Mumia zhuanghuii]|uniref:Hydrogenobyrinate a,c-diamide synthase n=2 Tax=Mumia TaxID=1546255 RepID=A0ABW1QPJ3_9ACTN|nr:MULTISPECIES: cobyrinate a,c-diamide synthase [Mumia]KAA1425438.1 cobyrinate a,c-diamide synthase [Mumia zhuanghuii]